MDITWLGHSGFRVRGKEATVIIDPPPFEGKPSASQEADMMLLSHHHKGHTNRELVKGEPLVFDGPGEYESQDVPIFGLSTFHDDAKGERLGKNVVFRMELEALVLCHLGDLGHGLSSQQVEDLGAVDILLVPVGGGSTINASKAAEMVKLIGPKVVVPMHYRQGEAREDLDTVDKFLNEMGVKEVAPQPRLTVSRSTLPQDTQVVVLEARRS